MKNIDYVASEKLDHIDLAKYYNYSEKGYGVPDNPLPNPMQRVTIRNIFSSTPEQINDDMYIEMDRCNVIFDQDGKISINDMLFYDPCEDEMNEAWTHK